MTHLARKKNSRLLLTTIAVVLVAGVLTAAFWPRSVLVDMADVRQGEMIVTINEEGRTRVKEPYVVSSPVAGELQRVTVLPGERVVGGETIVARMQPTNPSALDVRTREQAHAAVTAAEAALRVAHADLNAALAKHDFAESDLERAQKLVDRGVASKVAMERAEQAAKVAKANLDTVRAAIAMREAELANARAQLIGFDDMALAAALADSERPAYSIPLRAPIDGTILKVNHKSETTLPAGEPILEIGDVDGDLEVMAELLSSDAVQVTEGDRVVITNWGGQGDLTGTVSRIDPYGYTKYSALGVEEQRVETTIQFANPGEDRGDLGHGYRVEIRIVVWEKPDAVVVPSAALFRQGQDWAVFVVDDGRAKLRKIDVGRNNGVDAEVLGGLETGDTVVLFPSANLVDGMRIARRQLD
ncbi:HlyD family efflux transporter periplasmic adaptor subunit [Ruegeria sediminis]|uniref:HlyD family efflux transporter periplasmic adaptor subunit n=1 Tax=Ruegeria sediminis TaxID=2583820 RepID=A0ABY2X1A6_9RHOB|nr:HlyD family efflux transporter periplasmic adaptor subunit [Ruegeria sediminis]TMV09020.1 HlyD family efflux transporter periplasmic adaptor subunit [Ruegeria sediminis]